MGQVRPRGEGVRRPEQGQRQHRPRRPLPGPGPGRKPPSGPAAPTPSSASATGGSPAAAARKRPSSLSADPSWSSSGTCCLRSKLTSKTWAPTSTTSDEAPKRSNATTSASSKHSASPSPSNPPPPDRSDPVPAPLRYAGSFACPLTIEFRIRAGGSRLTGPSSGCSLAAACQAFAANASVHGAKRRQRPSVWPQRQL